MRTGSPGAPRTFAVGAALALSACAALGPAKRDGAWESFTHYHASAVAPYPAEIGNVTQSRALCREAAVSLAQAHLLERLLRERTNAGERLRRAEIPDVRLQNAVRSTIRGAEIRRTVWTEDGCRVELELPKARVKPLLRFRRDD